MHTTFETDAGEMLPTKISNKLMSFQSIDLNDSWKAVNAHACTYHTL